ncbi:sorting nexin-25-like isoform X1 [Leptopilina heterotoma]|uniref:sorting nexin-25-like isoform X1 n=1 Tax=Leptopilina heterotoma TaxID=63436 RepID=UPI001CA85074|nr:sorting nexin-25-like isoform X1 [Leptopilina heterotoma]
MHIPGSKIQIARDSVSKFLMTAKHNLVTAIIEHQKMLPPVIIGLIVIVSFLFIFLNNLLWILSYGVLTFTCLLLGPLIVIMVHIALSPKHETGRNTSKTIAELDAFRNMLMKNYEPKSISSKKQLRYPLVFTRLVDGALQNLLDLAFRDFVGAWLNDLSFESDQLIDSMKQDVWGAIQSLHERLAHIDSTKLVACSVVNRVTFHFEKIRIAQAAVSEGLDPVFILSPHLMTREAELEYLRKVSELCIMLFLPGSYSLTPTKFLLREIVTCKILKPAIDMVTDPDYINQKILSYIEQQQMTEAMHRKTYEYAESFEDFIQMIKSSRDLEVLKHIRYNIVTEIMQATTIQNVKRAQGLDPESNSLGKSDAIQARKLKRYISQLTYAKNTCECHMQSLGWDGFLIQENDLSDPSAIGEGRILPLPYILENVIGRRHLSQFLEQVSSQGLIGYWAAVQELRAAKKSSWHQLGAEIFYTYIKSPTAEMKVDKNMRKRMESFLMGDNGPHAFYEVQETVVKTLQDKYYPSFIVSEQYKKMQEALINERVDGLVEDRQIDGTINDTSLLVGEHSNYARSKLDQLQEKLNNKMQALQALRSSLKPESRVLSILGKEVEYLQGEKRQLEAHLTHTEMWAEHLGHWRADVQSAEVPDNGDPPQFILVVHMAADEESEDKISTGWVVLRKLTEFQELNRKLRQLCSSVKNLELPSQPLKFFGKSDKNTIDKARAQIQKYLNFVLEDDRLNQSEALYAFLSPSSEHLKHTAPSPKKSRFFLSTLFKSSSGSSGSGDSREKEDEEDYSCFFDDNEPGRTVTDSFLGPGKDAIVEPLYSLLGEVFDLKGVFRWLRRSLITFVQITYGRTINRQVRDTVTWLLCEPMLHYYITLFTKSWWPNGQLVSETTVRNDEEKLMTRGEARRQFLNNVPDVLTNLVGAQNSQRGATKIFDTLQNVNLNKQLFYDIFEVLMYEVFPELQKNRGFNTFKFHDD